MTRLRFVLHEHDVPRHHFDLRLEEDGVLRSWAVPRGMPTDPTRNRLAVPVDDHDLAHATYEDATKRIADTGWWELEDRDERRFVFVLHGRTGPRRYALITTSAGALLHLVRDRPGDPVPPGDGSPDSQDETADPGAAAKGHTMTQNVDDAPDPAGEEFLKEQNTVEKVSPDTTADAPATDADLISTDPTPSSDAGQEG